MHMLVCVIFIMPETKEKRETTVNAIQVNQAVRNVRIVNKRNGLIALTKISISTAQNQMKKLIKTI